MDLLRYHLPGVNPSIWLSGVILGTWLGQYVQHLGFSRLHPQAGSFHVRYRPVGSLHLVSLTSVHPPHLGQGELSRNTPLLPTLQRRVVTLRIKSRLRRASHKTSTPSIPVLCVAPSVLQLSSVGASLWASPV